MQWYEILSITSHKNVPIENVQSGYQLIQPTDYEKSSTM